MASHKNKSKKRLHTRVKHHYYRVMPNKKHHRAMVWAVFFSVVAVIAYQLLYPPDRALPFARISDTFVGMQTETQLAREINDRYQRSRVIVAASTTTYLEVDIGEVGAEALTAQATLRLQKYPFWQRFVPLSIVFKWPHVRDVPVEYQSKIVTKMTEEIASKLTVPAQNAKVSITNGEIVAHDEKPGTIVASADVKNALIATAIRLGTVSVVPVKAVVVSPQTTAKDLVAVRTKIEQSLAKTVTIHVDDKQFTPDRTEIASWLRIDRGGDNSLIVAVDGSKLSAYLDGISDIVGTKPGTTAVTIVNGIETARIDGASGKRIATEQASKEIAEQLLSESTEGVDFIATLVDVPAVVMYNNKYTASQEGLQSYVTDAARMKNANIVIEQLDGPRWRASADGSLSTVSASTYKVFVALYLFDQMNKGAISWSDPMLDTTVSGCFDRMTIASTNPCAQAWLSQWGRENVNQFVYKHGFSQGTTFKNSIATHTTADDLAKFMVGLEQGTLIQGAQRDRLLHSLRVHPYRTGVPSGSDGEVWDKVGFLWDYVHDAAIVHHPRGRYIIVVMTKGRSYATIAGITREVEKILYP